MSSRSLEIFYLILFAFNPASQWITIQHDQDEDWKNMINLWKYSNLHIIYVLGIDSSIFENQWYYD
jgi:hypothetical protein